MMLMMEATMTSAEVPGLICRWRILRGFALVRRARGAFQPRHWQSAHPYRFFPVNQ